MIPPKLNVGDEIRIVAPAASLSSLSRPEINAARNRLSELGYMTSVSKHAFEKDMFFSSSIKSRLEDFHAAFEDPNVRMLLCARGGFNSNQLLKFLDYKLIRRNPKILCGYSDITAIANSIFAKTGLVTYSGPNLSAFSAPMQYVEEYFRNCFILKEPFKILPSSHWLNDRKTGNLLKNNGYELIHSGEAEGVTIGGNISTLNLLLGTEFMPKLKGSILFLEDDDQSGRVTPVDFDRNLQSLLHQRDSDKIAAIVIGRFQKESQMSSKKITEIINTKEELRDVPVISNADFGHTFPIVTFPIGGKAKLVAKKNKIELEIIKH